MNQQIQPYREGINVAREKFIKISDERTWDRESIFAMQLLARNDYTLKIANQNKASVTAAMLNAAATGLTLNPALGYAYLVPRDSAIMLDISYKGLLKIATDAGVVQWGRADVVRKGDSFVYNGPAALPVHNFDPFEEGREKIAVVGSYCFIKTKGGDILTEVMPWSELAKIRDKSTAYTRGSEGKKGPWVDFFEQMCKKAVIKRGAKTWPYSSGIEKIHEAIQIANDAEGGYDLEGESTRITPRGGVYAALSDGDKKSVDEASVIVREYFDNDDPKGAYDYTQRLGLDAEQQIALYDKLTAPMRTALKVCAKTVATLGHQQ